MNKNNSINVLLNTILISSILFLSGCTEDPIPEIERDTPIEKIPEANEVNKFIWEGLALYYYWNQDVPNLVNPKFNNNDSLNYFLNKYSDPEQLFNSLLYKKDVVDKYSFIVDNSKEIDDWLTGISESMGFDFMLSRIGGTDDLFGYVRYVIKGSPADLAGIKRGDYFIEVDDTQITISNYQSLLFSKISYKLTMAQIENSFISENGIVHEMTAVELQENPILLDTVLNVEGMDVGYLVYTGFTSAYSEELGTSYDLLLNDAFGRFKNAGIQKLIVDFRYNSGGSNLSSIYLASMIYGTDKSSVFIKYKYNGILENHFQEEYGEEFFNEYFTDVILKEDWNTFDVNGDVVSTVTTPETPINSLNLSEVYVITSPQTASASELIINGLESYIDVKTYGTNTAGKNVGSFTIRDWDEEGVVNPNHSWAMQPITLKVANADNYSDYHNGLKPDVIIEEDPLYMLPLGDKNELLLDAVLSDMQGIAMKSARVQGTYFTPFRSSKDESRFSNEMYIESDKIIQFIKDSK